MKDMDTALSAAEQDVVKPYFVELYEQGIEQGIEQGLEEGIEKGMERLILAFYKKNPTFSAAEIAAYFEIEVALVERMIKSMK